MDNNIIEIILREKERYEASLKLIFNKNDTVKKGMTSHSIRLEHKLSAINELLAKIQCESEE